MVLLRSLFSFVSRSMMSVVARETSRRNSIMDFLFVIFVLHVVRSTQSMEEFRKDSLVNQFFVVFFIFFIFGKFHVESKRIELSDLQHFFNGISARLSFVCSMSTWIISLTLCTPKLRISWILESSPIALRSSRSGCSRLPIIFIWRLRNCIWCWNVRSVLVSIDKREWIFVPCHPTSSNEPRCGAEVLLLERCARVQAHTYTHSHTCVRCNLFDFFRLFSMWKALPWVHMSISSEFNWIFSWLKNYISVYSEKNSIDFCVIFSHSLLCQFFICHADVVASLFLSFILFEIYAFQWEK